jgi:short-subunit dehydrogenase
VEAVSDALRYEVAPFGVAVVLVEPGPVRTAFGDTALATIDTKMIDAEGTSEPAYDAFMADLGRRVEQAYDGRRTAMASSAEQVARVVVRAVESDRPRARYLVGPVARALVGLRRFAPATAFDVVIRRTFPVPRPGQGSRSVP